MHFIDELPPLEVHCRVLRKQQQAAREVAAKRGIRACMDRLVGYVLAALSHVFPDDVKPSAAQQPPSCEPILHSTCDIPLS